MRNLEDIVVDIRYKVEDMRSRADCNPCKKENCPSYNFCLGVADDYEQIANCLEELAVYRENYPYNDVEVNTIESIAFKNGQNNVFDTLLKQDVVDKSVVRRLQAQMGGKSTCPKGRDIYKTCYEFCSKRDNGMCELSKVSIGV